MPYSGLFICSDLTGPGGGSGIAPSGIGVIVGSEHGTGVTVALADSGVHCNRVGSGVVATGVAAVVAVAAGIGVAVGDGLSLLLLFEAGVGIVVGNADA